MSMPKLVSRSWRWLHLKRELTKRSPNSSTYERALYLRWRLHSNGLSQPLSNAELKSSWKPGTRRQLSPWWGEWSVRSNPSGLWNLFRASSKQNPVAKFLPTWSVMCWRPSSLFHTGKSGEFPSLATWNETRYSEVYMRRRCSQCTLAGNESST